VPQEVQLLHCKLTILQVDGEAVVLQALEHGPQVLYVLVKSLLATHWSSR
jgi:hypothetical protein